MEVQSLFCNAAFGLVFCALILFESVECRVSRLADVALRIHDADREARNLTGNARTIGNNRQACRFIRRIDRITKFIIADSGRTGACRNQRSNAGHSDKIGQRGSVYATGAYRDLTVLHPRNLIIVGGHDFQRIARTILEGCQSGSARRARRQALVEQKGLSGADRVVLGAVDEIFAVELHERVVVNLVDELIQFLLNGLAIFVGVGIVGGVDCLFLHSLQDFDGIGYRAFGGLHHAGVVLAVLIRLVERTDANSHALGDGIAGGVVLCAIDFHAACDFRQALLQRRAVLVQNVERANRAHVVLYYHTHDLFPP